MGEIRATGVVLAWVTLGGCVADGHDGPVDDSASATAKPEAALGSRNAPALRGCDGAALPLCDGPFTGAACDLPCNTDTGPLACGLERTCHSNGRTYGVAVRNAVLYEGSPEDADAVVEADSEAWITEHPADLGLAAELTVDDVELHRTQCLPLGGRTADGLSLRADVSRRAGAGAGWDRDVGVRASRCDRGDRRDHRWQDAV